MSSKNKSLFLISLLTLMPIFAFAGDQDRPNRDLSSKKGLQNQCSKSLKGGLSSGAYRLSRYDQKVIKSYIFSGPIINFYLRNINIPGNQILAKALFKANNLTEESVKSLVVDLDRILLEQGLHNEKQILFRGETRPNDGTIRVGTVLHYQNYISTTKDKNLAIGFANGSDTDLKVIYEIQLDEGQPGSQINELAPEGMRNQNEFLLPRNGGLLIESVTNDGEFTRVKARFLPESEKDVSAGMTQNSLLKSARAGMNEHEILDLLKNGAIIKETQAQEVSNGKSSPELIDFLDSSVRAVKKAIPLEYARREVQVYKGSLFLGIDLVPPTVLREIDDETYVIQLFVPKTVDLESSGKSQSEVQKKVFKRWEFLAEIFSLLDNISSNLLIPTSGDINEIVVIDNEASLSTIELSIGRPTPITWRNNGRRVSFSKEDVEEDKEFYRSALATDHSDFYEYLVSLGVEESFARGASVRLQRFQNQVK